MKKPKMRVFAGPNGSGKTTIMKDLQSLNIFKMGVYVNADDIESELNKHKTISFELYEIQVTNEQLQTFFRNSLFSPQKRNEIDLWQKLAVENNVLTVNTHICSYLAADLAEFIRQSLLENNISFSYETVMSHPNKISFFKKAKEKGYKVYLYFVSTESPQINVNRVRIRVSQKGHQVPEDVVINRYYKSLQNLKEAIKQTDRAYLFDNSGPVGVIIAEVQQGVDFIITDENKKPNWLKYLLN